jgi:hypothetical protein
MDLGNAAQWVGAVGTISAVIVALFKEEIQRWFRRPELVAVLKAEYPYCVKTPEHHGSPPNVWRGSRYWIRVMVWNHGNARAEQVEVFLSSVTDEKTNELVHRFVPMNFRWSNTDKIYAVGISPDMSRLCDLAAVSDAGHPEFKHSRPSGLSNDKQTCLSLRTESVPSRTDWLPPGKYVCVVRIAASNCKPKDWKIRLHLTGQWSEDEKEMLPHGIDVSVIET